MQYDGRVHVWVKKEDRDTWESIADKPAWLHAHLNDECLMESIVDTILEKEKSDTSSDERKER